MIILFTCLILISISFADFSTYKYHDHLHPKKILSANLNPNLRINGNTVGGSDDGALSADKTVVSSPNDVITVSWFNISYPSYYDWIGLYNYSENDPLWFAAPPIKYQYVCPKATCSKATASGSLKFKLLNRRTIYAFVYYGGTTQYGEVRAISQPITYDNLYEPMHIHIAVVPPTTETLSTMPTIQVMWTQKEVNNPVVYYGTSSNNVKTSVKALNWTTYTRDDLCDQQYGLPAGTIGFFIPGYSISAYLTDLTPNTLYFYQVSDDDYGTSQIYNFTSPPLYGSLTSDNSIKFVAFGDLGNVAVDYSNHHSWDWSDEGEIYSVNTTHMITNYYMNGPYDKSDFLIHIGDISYAVGYTSEWDDFMYQIEPIASHIPYMTGIGNHEYSWTGEWKPSTTYVTSDAYSNSDGGGECGVPYGMYFPYSSSSSSQSLDPNVRQPWYYVDYGMIRTIIMSTEHDFSANSVQYQYIYNVLQNTDRVLFPWILIAGHRPMYANSNWDGDVTTAEYLRLSLEDLLLQYKVAMGFWGHQHSYSRTCNVYNQTCQTYNNGTTHIVMGMAGYELTSSIPTSPASYYHFTTNKYYGFLHFTVYNQSHCYGKFVNSTNGGIIEDFWVANPYVST